MKHSSLLVVMSTSNDHETARNDASLNDFTPPMNTSDYDFGGMKPWFDQPRNNNVGNPSTRVIFIAGKSGHKTAKHRTAEHQKHLEERRLKRKPRQPKSLRSSYISHSTSQPITSSNPTTIAVTPLNTTMQESRSRLPETSKEIRSEVSSIATDELFPEDSSEKNSIAEETINTTSTSSTNVNEEMMDSNSSTTQSVDA